MKKPKFITLLVIGISQVVLEEAYSKEFADSGIPKNPFKSTWKDSNGKEVEGTEFNYVRPSGAGKRYLVNESLETVMEFLGREVKQEQKEEKKEENASPENVSEGLANTASENLSVNNDTDNASAEKGKTEQPKAPRNRKRPQPKAPRLAPAVVPADPETPENNAAAKKASKPKAKAAAKKAAKAKAKAPKKAK